MTNVGSRPRENEGMIRLDIPLLEPQGLLAHMFLFHVSPFLCRADYFTGGGWEVNTLLKDLVCAIVESVH